MTNEQLRKAPLVKGGGYDTLLGPGFADQVYRYFNANRTATGPGHSNAARP